MVSIQLGALLVGTILFYLFRRKDSGKLPPGPKGLPIIGNLMDLPPSTEPEYLHWLKFKDLYGPLSAVTVLGQTMVIIHGKQEAHDILEKRSLQTSSRAESTFARICGFGRFLPFIPYDRVFRAHRKLMHQQLGTMVATSQFNDIQEIESHRFLLRCLNSPHRLPEHLKT